MPDPSSAPRRHTPSNGRYGPSPSPRRPAGARISSLLRSWSGEGGGRSPSPEEGGWLGEIERDRVRVVREWVHAASRSGGEGGDTETRAGGDEDGGDARRPLRPRRARIEMLPRIVEERERELRSISGQRLVSNFVHRDTIQSLLRGRFLHDAREESPLSISMNEWDQLRQHHQDSEIREGSLIGLDGVVNDEASSHAETPTTSGNVGAQVSILIDPLDGSHGDVDSELQSEMENPVGTASVWQDSDGQEHWLGGNEIGEQQEESEVGYGEWPDGAREGSDNWQEAALREWPHVIEAGEDTDWQEEQSHTTVESWPDESSNANVISQPALLRRPFRFSVLGDDNVHNTELRELVGRRSVSNLLQSEFRDNLDQLVQSYVQSQRRRHSPGDWSVENQFQNAASSGQEQVVADSFNINRQDSGVTLPHVFPSPAPPSPIWQPEMQNWRRYRRHQSTMEGDVINDLRVEMARLQQDMGNMQRMLETCMDMQLDLQRTIGEEVSAALSRSVGRRGERKACEDGSNWTHVKKGTCCICCDSHIDSLLYRCGHMCSCWRCATELIQSDGKCPLCRAPIIDVIRAYSLA